MADIKRKKDKEEAGIQRNNNFFFCSFCFLMVCAKGVGLDSGDSIYFFMAIISIPLWILYITSLYWSPAELRYAMTIFAIACITTVITGMTGIILSVMAMIAMKDIERERLMRQILKLWASCMAIVFFCVMCGIIPDRVVNRNGKIWHGMGYLTGNLFHASVVILMILYLYYRKVKVTYTELFLLCLANWFVYQYSASRTGLIVGIFAVVLDIVLKLFRRREGFMKWIMSGLTAGMIMVFLFSFLLPFMYNGDWGSNNWVSVLNRMFTGRIQNGKAVFLSDSITLFGNQNGLSAFLDNAFMFLLVKYGIVVTLMLCMIYIIAVKSMIQRKNIYGIYVIFLFVLYGFMEQFFINSFMNYSMLLAGNEIMNVVLRGHGRTYSLRERKTDVRFE